MVDDDCPECEVAGSELLQKVCKVIHPEGFDCNEVLHEYEEGKIDIQEFAKRVFTLLVDAPPEKLDELRGVLEEYAPELALIADPDPSPDIEPEEGPVLTDMGGVPPLVMPPGVIGNGTAPVAPPLDVPSLEASEEEEDVGGRTGGREDVEDEPNPQADAATETTEPSEEPPQEAQEATVDQEEVEEVSEEVEEPEGSTGDEALDEPFVIPADADVSQDDVDRIVQKEMKRAGWE